MRLLNSEGGIVNSIQGSNVGVENTAVVILVFGAALELENFTTIYFENLTDTLIIE